jgi:hypothetical protein
MRFSIRDLLWATLVVALCVAWWLDRSEQRRRAVESDTALASLEVKLDLAMRLVDPLNWPSIEKIHGNWNNDEYWATKEGKMVKEFLNDNSAPKWLMLKQDKP